MVARDSWHSRGTLDERVQRGLDARRRVPHDAHSDLYRAQARPEPLDLILTEDEGRLERLIPIRHEQMRSTLHEYFRGTPSMMAADLSVTPVSGIAAQAVGNADVLNFRSFTTPAGLSGFGVLSFDETLRGPWEWDIKRLAASMAVAARAAGAPGREQRALARSAVNGYRRGMAWAVRQDRLKLWFESIPEAELDRGLSKSHKVHDTADRAMDKREFLHHLSHLTEVVGSERRLLENPPAVVDLATYMSEEEAAEVHNRITDLIHAYTASVGAEIQEMLNEYRPVDVALSLTGVADIGLRCLLVLLQGAHPDEWMLLQVKEARQSVLQPYVLPEFRHRGSQARRVVLGEALLQAAQDPLLGFTRSADRDYYVRQMWPTGITALNVKGDMSAWTRYARLCGFAMARAHAVTGDRVAIDAYLGDSDSFDKAVSRYAVRYADLVESDHTEFCKTAGTEGLTLAD